MPRTRRMHSHPARPCHRSTILSRNTRMRPVLDGRSSYPSARRRLDQDSTVQTRLELHPVLRRHSAIPRNSLSHAPCRLCTLLFGSRPVLCPCAPVSPLHPNTAIGSALRTYPPERRSFLSSAIRAFP